MAIRIGATLTTEISESLSTMQKCFSRSVVKLATLAILVAATRELSRAQEATPGQLDSPQQRRGAGGFGAPERGVYKSRITPHWLAGNTQFWYRNDLRGGTREFVLVDVERGTRQAAFDHQQLAAALSRAAGAEYRADRLPFDRIEFVEAGKAIQFKVANTTWQCDLTSYECSRTQAKATPPPADEPAEPASRDPEEPEEELAAEAEAQRQPPRSDRSGCIAACWRRDVPTSSRRRRWSTPPPPTSPPTR